MDLPHYFAAELPQAELNKLNDIDETPLKPAARACFSNENFCGGAARPRHCSVPFGQLLLSKSRLAKGWSSSELFAGAGWRNPAQHRRGDAAPRLAYLQLIKPNRQVLCPRRGQCYSGAVPACAGWEHRSAVTSSLTDSLMCVCVFHVLGTPRLGLLEGSLVPSRREKKFPWPTSCTLKVICHSSGLLRPCTAGNRCCVRTGMGVHRFLPPVEQQTPVRSLE